MNRYSFFAGCKIPYFLSYYGSSSLALLQRFQIDPVDIEFNCCGYPIRDIDLQSYLISGAKNLALAEQAQTDILTPCKCCYGSLKFVEHYLTQHPGAHTRTNEILQQQGLRWEGRSKVHHLLSVLVQEAGLETLRSAVTHPFKDLRVAVHLGCHALRPGNVTQFDNPLAPQMFEDIVAATGARPVFWSLSSDCCGSPQSEKNERLARRQMQRKVRNAKQAGADFICTACTYCQIHFDQQQTAEANGREANENVPAILASQLLGLSMGMDATEIGIDNETKDRLRAL